MNANTVVMTQMIDDMSIDGGATIVMPPTDMSDARMSPHTGLESFLAKHQGRATFYGHPDLFHPVISRVQIDDPGRRTFQSTSYLRLPGHRLLLIFRWVEGGRNCWMCHEIKDADVEERPYTDPADGKRKSGMVIVGNGPIRRLWRRITRIFNAFTGTPTKEADHA